MVGEPFFARFPTTVIWSPGLNKFLVQPIRDMVVMLAASALHFSTLPVEASFTSRKSSECGFMNWKSVTVPLSVVNFLVSYADAPWCAKSGVEAAKSPRTKAKNVKTLDFIEHPLNWRKISHCR